MNDMNDWEKAFNTMPQDNDEIKQRQREIKQQEWAEELPNISAPLRDAEEMDKVATLLQDFRQDNESLHKTVKRLLDIYNRLRIQNEKVRKAMLTL